MFTDAIDIAEVQQGVLRLRLPSLHLQLDAVSVWLLRDCIRTARGLQSGWTVLDTGPDTQQVRALWQVVFSKYLDGLPVLRVCVTRAQPDSAGLARWLCEWWSSSNGDCQLWISAGEFYAAHRASHSISLATELAAQFAASHGVQTPFELEVVKAHAHMHAERVPKLPNRFWRLVGGRGFMVGEGDQQRMLTSIVGRGHSVEAISLYCHQSKALYAGDMLCPDTITALRLAPDEPEADAVHLLLDSLELLRDLPAGVSLYSAHGLRAMALGDRVAEMQTHYADQLALVLRACAGGAITAYELTQQWAPQSLGQAVRPPLPDALSLTVAYLNALWHARLVERENRAGIWWFWAHK